MKRDKRGFTLIEMMAVIIILGILLMIAVPAVNRYLANVRLEYYRKLEESVKSAGEEYTQDKKYIRPTKMLYSTLIKVDKLENGKYIDEVKDYLGKKCDSSDTSYSYVVVVKSGEQEYKYQACLKCSEDEYVTDTSKEEMDLCNAAWMTNDGIEYVKPAEMGEVYAYYSDNQDDFKSQVGITYDVVKKDSEGNILAKVENPGEDESDIIYPDNIGALVGQNEGSVVDLEYTLPDNSKIQRKAYIYKHHEPIIKITYADDNIISGRKTGEAYINGEWSHKLKIEAKFSESDMPEVFSKGGITLKRLEYYDSLQNEWKSTSCVVSGNKLECVWSLASNFNKSGVRFRLINSKDQISDATTKGSAYTIRVDVEAPTCGSISGDSTTWINKTRTVTIGCNDKGDSKCNKASYSMSYPTETEKNKKIGSLTIYDNAGNSRVCSANTYVDTTRPTNCVVTMKDSESKEVGSGSTSKVNVTISASGEDKETDASGIKSITFDIKNGKGTSLGQIETTKDLDNDTYTITPTCTDVAGNVTTGTISTITLDKSVVITYAANGGTGQMAETVCKYNQDCQIATNLFSKRGYTMTSWNTASDGKGSSYKLGGTIKSRESLTLYAQWTANKYTIAYSCNGGNGTIANETATYDQNYTVNSGNACSKKGYTFQGWTSASNGQDDGNKWTGWSGKWTFINGERGIINGKLTLYARWKAKTMSVTLKQQGGTIDGLGSDKVISATYDQHLPKVSVPTRTGYTFTGYYDATSGGTKYINTDGSSARLWDKEVNTTLYAQWTANKYTVKFDKQKGSGGQDNVVVTYDQAMPKVTVPTRTGYTLQGYYDATSGGTKYYNADGTSAKNWNKPNDATLYAQWKANTYTVTLKGQGGNPTEATVIATYDAAMPKVNKPTRSGFRFTGYFDAASGGKQYYKDDGTSARAWDKTSNTTLYAQWVDSSIPVGTITTTKDFKKNSQTATINCTDNVGVVSYYWGTKSSPAASEYTGITSNANYTTTKTVSGSGTYYLSCKDSTGNISTIKSVTYRSYTVNNMLLSESGNKGTYNTANYPQQSSGTFIIPDKTVMTLSSIYTIPAHATSSTFAGYSTGTTPSSLTTSTPTISGNVTYYMWFNRTEYTITVITTEHGTNKVTAQSNTTGVSATKAGENKTITVRENETVTATASSETGYKLNNFTGLISGNTNPAKLVVSKSGEIKANFVAMTYTITFSHQGGSGGTGNITATYAQAMPKMTPASRTGYTLQGYYDAASGGVKYYNVDGTSAKNWDKLANTTLYAQWTANKYTVTLNGNGGTLGTASLTATYAAALPKVSSLPTRNGYTFQGFYDAASGGTKYINADGTSARNWDKPNGATLYAQWTANKYTITLKGQGGSPDTATVTATYNSAMPKVTPPTRTGYAFDGYYDATSGGTQYYKSDGTSARNWDKANIATLYARWTPTKSEVTLNHNNGSGKTDKVTATFDAGMPSVTVPSYAGYTFQGYYDATSGGTQYYKADGTSARTWNKVGAQTLYARWSANTYTITYLGNGNNGGSMAVSKCTFNNNCTLTANAFTKTSYSFVNWLGSDNKTYGNSATFKYTIVGDLTLTAQWKLSTFTVTLNQNGGNGGTTSVTATYGSAMPGITKPTKIGYTFQGYYDALSGGTRYYTASGASARNWDKIGDTTIYAHWTPNVYTITYYGNGSTSGATQTQNCTYLSNCIIKTNWFAKSGNTFVKWNTAQNGTGTPYTNNQQFQYTLTSNLTLYAQWVGNCTSTRDSYSAWSDWGTCSKACGTGTQTHSRTHYKISNYTGETCSSTTESESQNCNPQGCCDLTTEVKTNVNTSACTHSGCGEATQQTCWTSTIVSAYDSSVVCTPATTKCNNPVPCKYNFTWESAGRLCDTLWSKKYGYNCGNYSTVYSKSGPNYCYSPVICVCKSKTDSGSGCTYATTTSKGTGGTCAQICSSCTYKYYRIY